MGAPLPKAVVVGTANTNRNGTGTIQTIFTAGECGAVLRGAVVKAIGNTTAGMLRLYVGNGFKWHLLDEIATVNRNPDATTKSFSYPWQHEIGDVTLAPHERFGAAPHNAESFAVHPIGEMLP